MNGNFLSEGIRILLIIVIGGVLIFSVVFLLKLFQFERIFRRLSFKKKGTDPYKRSIKSTNRSISQERSISWENQLERLERRVGEIEKMVQSIQEFEKESNLRNGTLKMKWEEQRQFLENDFITKMIDFLNSYKKSKSESSFNFNNITASPFESVEKEKDIPVSPSKSYRELNNLNLILWWDKNAHERLSNCQRKLIDEFGSVQIEIMEAQGEEWILIAISNDGKNFYLVPRKGGWHDQVFQNWFTVEEGPVRPGVSIIAIKSFPRARKKTSGFVLEGQKGRLSVKI